MSTSHLTKIETPAQHTEAAAELRFLAARIRPEPAAPGDNLKPRTDADKYREGRALIAYHLQSAARLLQEIAEHMPKEPTT